MTQGAPVLAGMSNTATQTTEIDFSGPTWLDVLDLTGVCAFGLAVTNNNASMSATSGVQSFAKGPNSTAVYAVGNGRGVYAVGHGGVAVNAYSYTDIGVNSYGDLTGVKGATASSTGAGVVGENLTTGPGVIGTTASSTGAGVVGENLATGPGVVGTSAQGVGVTGIASGGKRPVAILGDNASGNSDGVAVVAQGGAGVGLEASGDRAAIRLVPAKGQRKPGPPTTGRHLMGEMMVDSFGNLFFCKRSGTPGTWVKVA
jgi:hypothetical protein